MGTISLHPDEFADIAMAYLYDMLRDEQNMPENEEFQELIGKMKNTGIKTYLYNYFISRHTDTRVKYKIVKKSLLGDGGAEGRIIVNKGTTDHINEEYEFDRELCKQIFRKVKEVRFKHPSKVLTEERIDKIIDYCVEQKKKRMEEQQNG